ncbi:uncharacterized protein FOMMEDRAFT_150505 [Fomitiporia mediterranea MF3/22]|uniref:uncharacterized protein n=1 Tax=Fomitiporia mediterranea (strain MF3/22) TaxID=694068 RepID=UPI0004409A86|nr:uncharacterized protein FOMMEDRAFT_150505 [Fomitiporia mediterranea MF3/22]EJD07911.1 hypothetical protein FOMMEDRAFT_150505 [Fomitiporia mediterranea MF3/22]
MGLRVIPSRVAGTLKATRLRMLAFMVAGRIPSVRNQLFKAFTGNSCEFRTFYGFSFYNLLPADVANAQVTLIYLYGRPFRSLNTLPKGFLCASRAFCLSINSLHVMLWRHIVSTAFLLSIFTTSGYSSQNGHSSQPGGNTTTSKGPQPSNHPTPGGSSSRPQFVIYSDKSNTFPDVANIQGYTVFAISFLLSTGAADQAVVWSQLNKNTRQQIKSKYNAAGIKVIVSAFGSTEAPTTSGVDPTKCANDMANWILNNDLDGIDVDYEDLGAMSLGKGEEWVITFTKTLRSKLPKGKYILTHAPSPPWFSTCLPNSQPPVTQPVVANHQPSDVLGCTSGFIVV